MAFRLHTLQVQLYDPRPYAYRLNGESCVMTHAQLSALVCPYRVGPLLALAFCFGSQSVSFVSAVFVAVHSRQSSPLARCLSLAVPNRIYSW